MISVKVNGNKITIKGHAMFADYGKDIVCSACSSIVTTTVNGCLSINRKYKKITILGHAMYDDYGKDIVCSACSSIVITTINGILALDKGSLSYLIGKKGMTIDLKNDDHTTQVLINNMVRLLKELEEKYPDNIEVK